MKQCVCVCYSYVNLQLPETEEFVFGVWMPANPDSDDQVTSEHN